MRARTPALLLCLLLALAACGGRDEPAGDTVPTATAAPADPDAGAPAEDESTRAAGDPGAALVAAGEASSGESARISFSSTSDMPGGTVTTTGEGVTAADGSGALNLTIDGPAAMAMPGQQLPLEIEVRTIGTVVYQRFPGLAEAFGTDAEWLSIDLQDSIPGFAEAIEAQSGIDASQQFAVLSEVADVEEVGREDVNGVPTTRYAGSASLAQLAEASGVDAALDAAGADVDQQMPIDVWVDDDGRVRRMVQQLDIEGVGTSTTTFEVLEYGVPVDVEAPPAADVLDLAELMGQMQPGV